MAMESSSESWMSAPDSNVRDGKRWGRATKDRPFAHGNREQRIGEKIIRHRMITISQDHD